MAVMNNMREYTKSILVILVLAFVATIIFDWGMDITGLKSNPGIIGKVEGVEITARQFDQAFLNELQAYRQRTGSEPPESQMDFMRNQVWEGLVQNILVQKTLQEKELMASDSEIIWRIFNEPPEILKSNPSFQNDQKQFDKAKYLAVLNDPSTADQWRPIEEYLRQTIPYEKLQQRLQASVRVTEDEIKREYLKQNQTVNVKYIFIDPKRFANNEINISEGDITSYYKQNMEEFKEEEKRRIEYVVFSTQATADDSLETRDLAARILERAKAGEDFSILAQDYSNDTATKDKGGDLGFFGKGTMVKPFEEAAFFSNVGDIVGPVESPFGLHIIKVEEKRIKDGKEEIKARHILFKFSPSQKTLDKARDDAEFFVEEAKQSSFEEAAEMVSATPQSSTFFAKGNGFVPGLGLNQRASDFIFSKGIGAIGDIIESPQGFFVFKVDAIQDERTKPLEEVSSLIRDKLKIQQQMTLATKMAQEIYEKINSGVSFEEVALEDSLDLNETGNFSRMGYVAGVGREPSFIGTAFALDKIGDISKPVKATRGIYLIKLLEKKAFDEKDFADKKERIASQLLQRKQSEVFARWYASVKADAKIEDYRSRFF